MVLTENKRVTSSMDCPLRIGANMGIHELFYLLVRDRKRETVVSKLLSPSYWSGPYFTGTSTLLFLWFRDESSSDGSVTAEAGSVLQIQRGPRERRLSRRKSFCFCPEPCFTTISWGVVLLSSHIISTWERKGFFLYSPTWIFRHEAIVPAYSNSSYSVACLLTIDKSVLYIF